MSDSSRILVLNQHYRRRTLISQQSDSILVSTVKALEPYMATWRMQIPGVITWISRHKHGKACPNNSGLFYAYIFLGRNQKCHEWIPIHPSSSDSESSSPANRVLEKCALKTWDESQLIQGEVSNPCTAEAQDSQESQDLGGSLWKLKKNLGSLQILCSSSLGMVDLCRCCEGFKCNDTF